MPTYKIRVSAPFMDAITNETVPGGSIFETDSLPRALKIIKMELGELLAIEHHKTGPKIMIHQKYCYKIGGIETANRQLAEAFKDRNLLFVYNAPNLEQMLAIGKTCDVMWDDGSQHYDVDVLIMTNYDSAPAIIDRVKAKKIYQQIHADFANLKKMEIWANFTWQPHERVDKVLAVSKTAQNGLKTALGIESVVVPNVLGNLPRPLTFMVMSRASAEKGIDRVIELIKRMDDAGKDFVVYICSTAEQHPGMVEELKNRHVVMVEPSLYNTALLKAADYLIQLSLNESYCYSVREALEQGVPCIVSRIPEFEKLIKDGKNGYLLDDDLGNLDIDKIFNKRPTPEPRHEKIPETWEKVLEGKL